MTESSIPLPVFTVLSTQAAVPVRWKKWDLTFHFYQEKDGMVSAVVTDHTLLIDTDRPLVVQLRVPLKTLVNTAKDLEELWTNYSRGSRLPEHEARSLAAVGRDLFYMLLPRDTADRFAVSNLIADKIRQSAAQWIGEWQAGERLDKKKDVGSPAMNLGFYSNCLHLPWNLLYVFDDFDDYGALGFLGFPFSTEESSTFDSIVKNAKKEWGVARPIEVSLQLDMKIDYAVHKPIVDHLAIFADSELKTVKRPSAKILREAFHQGLVTEEVLYFCCHTHERPPQLRLTDVEPLSAVLIEDWTSVARLNQWPIIFLNTCRGGATKERYRTDFVSAFIRGGSVAVIGAEAEIDETYAGWFASEFLRALFKGDRDPKSLGDIAHRVRQAGMSRAFGLTGLLYSVYSRVPVRFRERLDKKKTSASQGSDVPAVNYESGGSNAH